MLLAGFGSNFCICMEVTVFGRPFAKRFARGYRTVVMSDCLSCPVSPDCLSVTLVYSGQTVGWSNMKQGMLVGLGPGHIGDPATLPKGA